jgi:hypothetical protein
MHRMNSYCQMMPSASSVISASQFASQSPRPAAAQRGKTLPAIRTRAIDAFMEVSRQQVLPDH